MNKPVISINQLAVYSEASLSKKKQILKQQVVPNRILVPWYQKAKAAIKKYFKNVNDIAPLLKAIDAIEHEAKPTKHWIKINQQVSKEALKQMMLIRVPRMLRDVSYEIIKPSVNSIMLGGVEIKVAPDIVISAKINGKTVYGAIKIHISKNDFFDSKQLEIVSTVLHQFLLSKVVHRGDIVLPELCLCLDVFAGRIVGADNTHFNVVMEQIENICFEINKLWAA